MYFQSSEQIKYYDLRIYARALVGRGWLDLGASCYRAPSGLSYIFSRVYLCVCVIFFESVCLPSR
jgi:hypothetical protein